MSVNITVPFVSQFRSQVEMLNQQQGSKLRGAVRNETLQGEKSFYEQLGATRAVRLTARHSDTPRVDSVHARRMVTSGQVVWSDLIDEQDKVALLAEFQNPYAVSAADAIGREMDVTLIDAALGTAYTGHDGTTATSIGSANTVAVNYVESGAAANSGLTIGKLRRANFLLADNDNSTNEPWYFVGTPKQKDDLLRTTETTSSDYNTVKALVNGEINTFLGFNFIWTTQFANSTLGYTAATDINTCFAFRKSGLLLATGKDITTNIEALPTKNYSTQVYVRANFGATRMQEGSVISVACDRSP